MDHRLRRPDHILHGVRVPADRPHPGQPGHLGGDIQEPADAARRRRVHDYRVVSAAAGPLSVLAPDRLGGLASEQHVPQAGRDGGGEVHHAELRQRGARVPHAVEHLEIFDQRRFGIGDEREHVTALAALPGRAARRDGDPPLGIR
jgi:hypothetical protein